MSTNFNFEISVNDSKQQSLDQNHVAIATDTMNTNTFVDDLRPINEIPLEYRNIFANYPYFNVIQSRVIDTALYSDQSMVISAPTGSGKTTIFELAVVRYLINFKNCKLKSYKIVYLAPIKALCEERFNDWHSKFANFGLTCLSVTGDSDYVDIEHLLKHDLIISTPEKWDSITRKSQDNKKFACLVKLFMIDEVQLLHDESRGSNLEVVVSRMKTIQDLLPNDQTDTPSECKIRFVAVSATVPNVEDIATWLSLPNCPAKAFIFGEETRPVKLKKVVIGYNYNMKTSTPFKFDIMMNYKLQNVIMQYAEGKPTLIFCGTRKSAEMTSQYITQNLTININDQQRLILQNSSSTIIETRLKVMLIHGVSFHHAGLLPQDRSAIENLFRKGSLPILVTTSTLAMGVNLPAHLVIVKSTKHYYNGQYQDYSECMVQQMIGRAGRPQYDNTATAVILTSTVDKHKFENLVGGKQNIESSLHKHLTEHLNAEIVLHTITDLGVAMEWLTSTFLHIRARKNPRYYGLPQNLNPNQIDRKLLDMCQIEINKLVGAGMISIDMSDVKISPTIIGSLMAKYCVAFETMKLFTQINGKEILQQVLSLIAKCKEFSEIYLRVNDKKALNLLNKCSNRETIRFPFNGKIKTVDMKINCIIQAVFGCLQIVEPSLITESLKIMRIGERISKCLAEYLQTKNNCYSALLNSLILAKCFHARLWENSQYVSKQLSGIGNALSSALVNAKKNSFQDLLNSNPRDIERLIHRKPPMGNTVQDEIRHLPNYILSFEKTTSNNITILSLKVYLENFGLLKSSSTVNVNKNVILLVGDTENNILINEKYTHNYFIEKPELIKTFNLSAHYKCKITAHLISEDWVGIDRQIDVSFIPTEPLPMVRNNMEKAVTASRQKVNNKSNSHVQTFINTYFPNSKGIGQKLQNQAKKNKKPKRLNSEIKNNETTLASNKKNTLDDYLVNTTKDSKPATDVKEKAFTLDTQESLRAIVGDSIQTYNELSYKRNHERFPSSPLLNENSSTIKVIEQKPVVDDSCTQEKDLAEQTFSYNKRKVTINIESTSLLNLKMSNSLSQYIKKPKSELKPSAKTTESNEKLQEEQKENILKKNTNQKSIKWSSPLVISPKFKYSPTPMLDRETGTTSKGHDETISLFLNDLNNSDSSTIQSSESEKSLLNNVKHIFTPPSSLRKKRSTLRQNLSQKEKHSLPLSDRECSQNELSNTTEQLPRLKSEFNYEDTLISTSFLENMGLLNNRAEVTEKLTIDSTPQKEINFKRPLVINEYYSELLLDTSTNINEEKQCEVKVKETSSSTDSSSITPAVTQHQVQDKPLNNGSPSTNSSSDKRPSSSKNNSSEDLFDTSDMYFFSETSLFETNGNVAQNFEPREFNFSPVLFPYETNSSSNQENTIFGNSNVFVSSSVPDNKFLNQVEMQRNSQKPNLIYDFNTHSLPIPSGPGNRSPFFVQGNRAPYDIGPSNLNRNPVCHIDYGSSRPEHASYDIRASTLNRNYICYNDYESSRPEHTRYDIEESTLNRDSVYHIGYESSRPEHTAYDIGASIINRNSVCRNDYERSRPEHLMRQMVPCCNQNQSSHKHFQQCNRLPYSNTNNVSSYCYSQPNQVSTSYRHPRRPLKRFKAEALGNCNFQNYPTQSNTMENCNNGFYQNYVPPFTQNYQENYIPLTHSNHSSQYFERCREVGPSMYDTNNRHFIVPSENTLNVNPMRNDYYENLSEDENI